MSVLVWGVMTVYIFAGGSCECHYLCVFLINVTKSWSMHVWPLPITARWDRFEHTGFPWLKFWSACFVTSHPTLSSFMGVVC